MTVLKTLISFFTKEENREVEETQVRFNNQQDPHVLNQLLFVPTNLPLAHDTPMTASILTNKTNTYQEKTPSPTSMPVEYFVQWCGSTLNYVASSTYEKKDPLKLDEKPLKRLLMKTFPWIIDVTEVRIKPKGRIDPNLEGVIYFGPLEIHITVSPTHHSELMNPNIEKLVRDKLYLFLLPLLTCMYENSRGNPLIIFSPSHSETILEVL